MNNVFQTLSEQTGLLNGIISNTNSNSAGYHEHVTAIATSRNTIVDGLVRNAHSLATYCCCHTEVLFVIICIVILLVVAYIDYKEDGDDKND